MISIEQIDVLLKDCISIDPVTCPQGALLWELRAAVETVAGLTRHMNNTRTLNNTLRNEIKNLKLEARNKRFIAQHEALDVKALCTWGDQLAYIIRGYNTHFFSACDGISEPIMEPCYVAEAYQQRL